MTVPIRLLVIDDHAIVRAGLQMLICEAGMECVGEASNIRDAVSLAESTSCDVILLDLELGSESAIDALPQLSAVRPEARVLILTGNQQPQLLRRVMAVGAKGIVLKQHDSATLLKAIERVHAGDLWLDQTLIAAVLLGDSVPVKEALPHSAKIALLTTREREVISLIGEGLKNKQIAARLFLSETTVRHHLTSIFAKLQVTDRLELVIFAYKHSLVEYEK